MLIKLWFFVEVFPIGHVIVKYSVCFKCVGYICAFTVDVMSHVRLFTDASGLFQSKSKCCFNPTSHPVSNLSLFILVAAPSCLDSSVRVCELLAQSEWTKGNEWSRQAYCTNCPKMFSTPCMPKFYSAPAVTHVLDNPTFSQRIITDSCLTVAF